MMCYLTIIHYVHCNNGGNFHATEVVPSHRSRSGLFGPKPSFYMETIEVSRLSALAFYAAGEECYKGERFYWQNREKQ